MTWEYEIALEPPNKQPPKIPPNKNKPNERNNKRKQPDEEVN